MFGGEYNFIKNKRTYKFLRFVFKLQSAYMYSTKFINALRNYPIKIRIISDDLTHPLQSIHSRLIIYKYKKTLLYL